MKFLSRFHLLPCVVMIAGLAASQVAAQNVPKPPDPTHIPFTLPQNIKWQGPANGELQAVLFGDPNKPGIYGELIKWRQGMNSRPHFHNHDRFIYVVSGTWWVSSTNKYDFSTLYPLPAGTFAEDVANTVHWDGSKTTDKEPAVLLLVGIGPVVTTQVDENGKKLTKAGGPLH
jgi:quercetin dioxygenase-like cupin family protein